MWAAVLLLDIDCKGVGVLQIQHICARAVALNVGKV